MEGSHHHAFAAAVHCRMSTEHCMRLVTAILDQTGELLDIAQQDGVGRLKTGRADEGSHQSVR
jgi:hypothetical protein